MVAVRHQTSSSSWKLWCCWGCASMMPQSPDHPPTLISLDLTHNPKPLFKTVNIDKTYAVFLYPCLNSTLLTIKKVSSLIWEYNILNSLIIWRTLTQFSHLCICLYSPLWSVLKLILEWASPLTGLQQQCCRMQSPGVSGGLSFRGCTLFMTHDWNIAKIRRILLSNDFTRISD